MGRTGPLGRFTWRGDVVAGIAVLTAVAALVVGCATPQTGTPRVMQPGDFKMLAGDWVGDSNVQGTVSENIIGQIQDSGAYWIALRTRSGAQTPGMMKIVDGGVVYESPTSKGKMSFIETSTSWVWKWDGVTPDGRYVRNELTKAK